MATAKQAIKRWFKEHPTTYCPVVGQPICRSGGCDNAKLRADERCNIDLKQRMWERAGDDRPKLADLRLTPDRRRYVVNFPFDRLTLQDFKSVIPNSDRTYDGTNREWTVERRHWGMLNAMFSNFSEWDLALTKANVGRRVDVRHQSE